MVGCRKETWPTWLEQSEQGGSGQRGAVRGGEGADHEGLIGALAFTWKW